MNALKKRNADEALLFEAPVQASKRLKPSSASSSLSRRIKSSATSSAELAANAASSADASKTVNLLSSKQIEAMAKDIVVGADGLIVVSAVERKKFGKTGTGGTFNKTTDWSSYVLKKVTNEIIALENPQIEGVTNQTTVLLHLVLWRYENNCEKIPQGGEVSHLCGTSRCGVASHLHVEEPEVNASRNSCHMWATHVDTDGFLQCLHQSRNVVRCLPRHDASHPKRPSNRQLYKWRLRKLKQQKKSLPK